MNIQTADERAAEWLANATHLFPPAHITERMCRGLWKSASSLRDLGTLTALWLLGTIPSQPGYHGPVDVDEDQAPGLTEALVCCNLTGYVTYNSQAGYDGPGWGGLHWQQTAWVSGFTDLGTAAMLITAAEGTPYEVNTFGRRSSRLPVTWTLSEGTCPTVHTADGYWPRRELRTLYRGVGRRAMRGVYAAQQVAVIDPEPGRNTLWSWLADAIDAATREGDS